MYIITNFVKKNFFALLFIFACLPIDIRQNRLSAEVEISELYGAEGNKKFLVIIPEIVWVDAVADRRLVKIKGKAKGCFTPYFVF